MTNENLIHVKFEYPEAVDSKKELLKTEMSVLKVVKFMRQYKTLRINELKSKRSLSSKIRKTITDIKKIQRILPKADVRKDTEKITEIKNPRKKVKFDREIEDQLKDIQEKLRAIQA